MASTNSRHDLGPVNSFSPFKKEEIEQSIVAVFERKVQENADRPAIITGTQTLTYNGLNRIANHIANAILNKRGQGQEPVAIVATNDATSIAGIFGILKAGKICVPIDAGAPPVRASSIIADSQANIIVSASSHLKQLESAGSTVLEIINLDEIEPDTSAQNPSVQIAPTDLAHIIYTSGTTGEPKGVIDIHRNVLHHVMIVTNSAHYSNEDRMTLLRAPSSSGGLGNVYSALLNGACLFPLDVQKNGMPQLAWWLINNKITVYHSSATVFRHFVENLTAEHNFPLLRLIRLGSEQVTKNEFQQFQKHFSYECILVNALSCTEAISFCHNFLNTKSAITGEIVPVGYAVPDMEILLLDERGAIVGPETPGEIAIRSEFLSPGYWRKPELTRKVFIQSEADAGTRVYLTGDMGRMRADGCLEHIGRKDFQVKIRGHRVNTDEIEIMLLALPFIKQAAVVAPKIGATDGRLVAYIAFKSGLGATASQLRSLLSERLPAYMVPSLFVILPALPLTANGKLDRRRLPDPPVSRPDLDTPFAVPRTSVEEQIAQIWSEVLKVDLIGVNDNFLDLGGESLLAIRIVAKLNHQFQVNITVNDLFESATVANLSQRVTQDQYSG